MKPTFRTLFAVLAVSSLAACQGPASPSSTLTTSDASSSGSAARSTSSIYGATWRLVEMEGQEALPGFPVTATFGAPDSVSGSGGCNRYFGTATATDGRLTVSPLFGATRMYCAQPGVSDQESAYFSILAKVTGYIVAGDELRLSSPASSAALVFVRE